MPAGDVALNRPTTSLRILPALSVCLAATALFVVEIAWLGWILIALGLVGAWAIDHTRPVAERTPPEPGLLRDLSLISAGMLIVSAIPLAAELDNIAMLRFTVALGLAVLVPYVVSRYVYKDRAISFPWRGGGRWTTFQWVWLAIVLALGWLILPFYFITSGVYENWPVVDTPDLLVRLFIGVGAVGIWDELFFICTVFTLLRRHMSDAWANGLQAIVFVSFLWELGYRAWGPVLTIPFALLMGYIFLRTRSLWYVVTVHLLFDAVVFLVLAYAHNPGWPQIFLVSS